MFSQMLTVLSVQSFSVKEDLQHAAKAGRLEEELDYQYWLASLPRCGVCGQLLRRCHTGPCPWGSPREPTPWELVHEFGYPACEAGYIP